jgi:hypothetical protein
MHAVRFRLLRRICTCIVLLQSNREACTMRALWTAVWLLILSCASFAGQSPITGLPTYNGTYYGTPGTGGKCDSRAQLCDSTAGRMIYTTLYRDNYTRKSGCAGERCGKHPGIDIAVASGTPVVAVMTGKIHRVAQCDTTWGGLVVIEVDNPYKAGEKAYVSYAHLRLINTTIKERDPILQGTIIGQSGGATTDACRGTSTGAHLHFQVDRPHPGLYPWFPTGQVENADSDFGVTTMTHNPMPFVMGYAYHFTFTENNNSEWWGGNMSSYYASGGSLVVDSNLTYPYVGRSSFLPEATCTNSGGVICSRQITLDADIFKSMIVNFDFKCLNGPMTVWYRKNSGPWYGVSFALPSATMAALLPMGRFSGWTGILTDVIIQPSNGCSANPGPIEYYFKEVYFTR